MVGIGFIADWHINGFKANPDAAVTGMCHVFFGSERQRAAEMENLKKKCSDAGVRAYDSFASMVSDSEIDALIVGSINPYHHEHVVAAIAHGKHVMVEKPVVTDFGHLDEIARLSAESGIKVFPAHNFVYRNGVRRAKDIIATGALGQVVHSSFITTHTIADAHAKGWRAKRALGTGGALIDSGHHLIYQALYLLGRPVKLHGFTSTMVLKNMECEDTAQVSLLYPDGSMAVVMQSWTSDKAGMINGIRICGTQGSIVITDALYVNGIKTDGDVEYAGSFANQARAFSEYILRDVPPVSGLEDVRDTLKITFGAYRSAETDAVIDFRTL
jgi:predicted dehydrogenase